MRSVPLLAALVALAPWTAAPRLEERMGGLRGHVEVRLPVEAPARRPETRALGAALVRSTADRRLAVVYLDPAPRAAFGELPVRRAIMDQRNETFVPRVLAITIGTTVDFPNSDPIYHNVFSLSRVRPFDLGRYAAGKTKSIRFDRPGIVRVFCDIHSHMSAFILVFAHPFFAVTAGDGTYRIDGIPPGSYTVKVWNEVLARQSRTVTVGDGDSEVDFVLSREQELP